MHLLIKNQVLASRKNMVSCAMSTLLTYTEIFRLNGHDFVYFIFCYGVGFLAHLSRRLRGELLVYQ